MLAAIVRRLRLELYKVNYSNIEAVCDAMMPMPKANSKGMQVLVS